MSLFNPSRDEVRRFFVDTWRKVLERLPLTPMEMLARDRMLLHPEYHPLLNAGESSLEHEFTPETGQTNPFLHLSLHLAIAEQLQIDQPQGLRSAYQQLVSAGHSEHEAEHVILDCLAETLWRSAREALRNVDHHARASSVTVAVEIDDRALDRDPACHGTDCSCMG
jgi:hypothetical protein